MLKKWQKMCHFQKECGFLEKKAKSTKIFLVRVECYTKLLRVGDCFFDSLLTRKRAFDTVKQTKNLLFQKKHFGKDFTWFFTKKKFGEKLQNSQLRFHSICRKAFGAFFFLFFFQKTREYFGIIFICFERESSGDFQMLILIHVAQVLKRNNII